MLKEKDAVIRKIMMALDALVVSAAFFLSYYFRAHLHSFYKIDLFPFKHMTIDGPWKFSEQFMILIVVAPLWCFLLHKNGIYRSWRLRTTWQITWVVFKASILTVLFAGAFFFIFKILFVSRLFFIMFGVFGFLGLVGEKLVMMFVMHEIRIRGYNTRQILIIGTGRRAENFIRRIQSHPEWGLRIVGAIEDEAGRGVERVDGVEVIGDLAAIPDILHRVAIDEVVIVVPRLRLDYMVNAIRDCEIEGVQVTIAVDLFDMKIAKAQPSELDGIPLLSFKTTVPSEWQLLAKRAMDLAISGFIDHRTQPVSSARCASDQNDLAGPRVLQTGTGRIEQKTIHHL